MLATPPTEAQTNYVRGIQKRLHLPDRMLDDHCMTRFRAPFAQLDRRYGTGGAGGEAETAAPAVQAVLE
jgi:hypothetical protein